MCLYPARIRRLFNHAAGCPSVTVTASVCKNIMTLHQKCCVFKFPITPTCKNSQRQKLGAILTRQLTNRHNCKNTRIDLEQGWASLPISRINSIPIHKVPIPFDFNSIRYQFNDRYFSLIPVLFDYERNFHSSNAACCTTMDFSNLLQF